MIGPPYFIGVTFNGSPMMPRLFNPHLLHFHLLLRPDLVPLPTLPTLIRPTFKPPLGPFRRSKCPFKPMLDLRMPLFVTLFKNGTISSMGCLLPRANTFRIVRLV